MFKEKTCIEVANQISHQLETTAAIDPRTGLAAVLLTPMQWNVVMFALGALTTTVHRSDEPPSKR